MNFYSKLLAKAGLLTNYADFDTASTQVGAVGRMVWNDADGTVNLGLKGGNVTLQIGQEQVARVVNKSGGVLSQSSYQVVKVTDAQGQRLAVDLAQANNDANSADTLGIVTETIALNQEGFIITSGVVRDINTTGSLQGETWADGDILYLSPTTPGAITNIKPTAPQHMVIVGYVEYAHGVHGKIFVKIQNGYELNELHNVLITTPLNNQVLGYESSTGLWKNKSIADWLGYTPANAASISGTTGKLAKFTSSGAVGDSIVSESGTDIRIIGVGSSLSFDTTGLASSSTIKTVEDFKLSIHNNRGTSTEIKVGNEDIEFLTNTVLRARYTQDGQYITNGATDTGEAHIFGGSARVNGTLFTTGNITGGTISAGVNINLYSSSYGNNGLFNSYGTDNNLKFQAGALGNSEAFIYANTGVDLNIFAGGASRMIYKASGSIITHGASATGEAFIIGGSARVNNYLTIASGVPYLEFIDTSTGAKHYVEGNDSGLVIYADATNISSGSLIDFRIDGNTSRMSLSATELITFGATDTGEAHIFGGSARVNGFMLATGLLRTQDRLYITGDVAISSWLSSSLTAGYSSTSSYGWMNSQTSLRLGVNGSTQLNLTTSSATFSSSVIATSLRAVSGGVLALNRPDNGANSEIYTNSSNQLILSSAIGGIITLGANTLIGTTIDDNTNKLQVNGSAKVTGASTFGVFNANSPAMFTTNNTASTPAITAFKNTEDANADVLLIQSYFGGTGIVDVARIKANGAATFSSSITWGSASGQYMYAGGASHIFAYSNSTSNYLYSGGSGGFNINNAADSVVLMRVTDGGNVGIGTTSPTSKLSISDGATMYGVQTGTLLDIKRNVSNGNDTTSRSGLRLGNNSNAFQIWYGGTTDRLRFVDGGGSEVLTLVNGGNVGIGIIAPKSILDIVGNLSVTHVDSTSGYSEILFYENTTLQADIFVNGSTNGAYAGAGSMNIWNGSDAPIAFYTNGTNERMRITGGGNILIGTTTDAGYKFEVSGDTRLRNKTYIGTNGAYIEEYYDGSVYKVKIVDSAGNDIIL